MHTRTANKSKHPGLVDAAPTRRKGQNGKTIKQINEEAKEKKKAEEENRMRHVSKIENAEEARLVAAQTTPAGPIRTQVGRVTKWDSKVVQKTAPVAEHVRSIPHNKAHSNIRSNTRLVAQKNTKIEPPAKGKPQARQNPKVKVRDTIEVMKLKAGSQQTGENNNTDGTKTKRAHAYDTAVGT